MKGKIFNSQEVQAMIAGTKTQFREVIKPQPTLAFNICIESGTISLMMSCGGFDNNEWCLNWKDFEDCFTPQELAKKGPYQVGQKIFVKEDFIADPSCDDDAWDEHDFTYQQWAWDYKNNHAKIPQSLKNNSNIFYRANSKDNDMMWDSGKKMPQWASRITLQIKEIRVERLGSISADDCWKEGIYYSSECCQNYIAVADCNGNPTPSCCNNPNVAHPQPQFEQVWNATHKKPEEKFEASPWVWKVEFEIINNK
jgi:hypothetical protein